MFFAQGCSISTNYLRKQKHCRHCTITEKVTSLQKGLPKGNIQVGSKRVKYLASPSIWRVLNRGLPNLLHLAWEIYNLHRILAGNRFMIDRSWKLHPALHQLACDHECIAQVLDRLQSSPKEQPPRPYHILMHKASDIQCPNWHPKQISLTDPK